MSKLDKQIADSQTIKHFLRQMVNQDQRHTAAPIYYTIRDEVRETCHEIQSDGGNDFYVEEWDSSSFQSEDEILLEWCEREGILAERSYHGASPEVPQSHSGSWLRFLTGSVEEYPTRMVFKERGMFLTESDAERHLRQNAHHYSEKARTFVYHAWRAPEMEEFFKSLLRYFEIGKGESDYRI